MPAHSGAIAGTVAHKHSVPSSDGGQLSEGVTNFTGGILGEVLTCDGTDIPVWQSGGATTAIATASLSGTFTSTATSLTNIGLSVVKPNIAGGKCMTTVFLSCEHQNQTSCTFAIEDNGSVVSRMNTNKSNVTTDYCGNVCLSDVSDADGNTIQIQGMGLTAGTWHVMHNSTYVIPKVVCLAVG